MKIENIIALTIRYDIMNDYYDREFFLLISIEINHDSGWLTIQMMIFLYECNIDNNDYNQSHIYTHKQTPFDLISAWTIFIWNISTKSMFAQHMERKNREKN